MPCRQRLRCFQVAVENRGQSKITNLWFAFVVEEHILGLQITMKQLVAVNVVDRAGDFFDQCDGFVNRAAKLRQFLS